MPRAVLGFQRAVVRDRHRVLGERPQLHLAANAVRGTDASDADAVGHGCDQLAAGASAAFSALALSAAALSVAALAVAAVLAAASPASLALVASSRAALRSLRGIAFSGLLRFSRFLMPAASRKRMTRSDGCAPFFIQACALSRSNLSRSVFSFGSSGLKKPSRSMKRPSRGARLSATTM